MLPCLVTGMTTRWQLLQLPREICDGCVLDEVWSSGPVVRLVDPDTVSGHDYWQHFKLSTWFVAVETVRLELPVYPFSIFFLSQCLCVKYTCIYKYKRLFERICLDRFFFN